MVGGNCLDTTKARSYLGTWEVAWLWIWCPHSRLEPLAVIPMFILESCTSTQWRICCGTLGSWGWSELGETAERTQVPSSVMSGVRTWQSWVGGCLWSRYHGHCAAFLLACSTISHKFSLKWCSWNFLQQQQATDIYSPISLRMF